ncbi:MAG: hypothetical protein J5685_13095 [Clostridiales bacterium]|nr:hypothetical protein [Clostridiales bacterium]
MYSYEEFKEKMVNELPAAMGARGEEYIIRTMPVTKRGKLKDGFCLYEKNDTSDTLIMPTMYFDDIFADYSRSGDFERELTKTVLCMRNGIAKGRTLRNSIDIDNIRDRVVFQLINTGENSSILADSPHRKFLDLSVIYRWVVSVDPTGFSSALITNDLAESAGLDEQELFRLAYENTRVILPEHIVDFDDMVKDLSARDTDSDIEEMWDEYCSKVKMFMLTNNCGTMGASVLLYDNILCDLAERIKSDLYILPSSVNEVIAVGAFNTDPGQLIDLVRHVNATDVAEGEVLSDNIYYYSRSSGRLYTVATDMAV